MDGSVRLVGAALLGWMGAMPVSAGRVTDTLSNISFVPPPYFETMVAAKGTSAHFRLTPPDKAFQIVTGAVLDRKFSTVRPMSAEEIQGYCTRAATLLTKDFTVKLSKRFLADGKNGAECYFVHPQGQHVRWIGVPEAGQLVYFYSLWPKAPTKDQIDLYRLFLGSIQIF
ncbi:hypothetical protein [Anthocerotibacter panamensis]|uniref:hypothetical protein n=1 Tax=Anthocerotibacter panamensis TaxID=2857077 RepID=UPI001C402F81|nr:hypothetical protein [Anthocerotibacter panamensis]